MTATAQPDHAKPACETATGTGTGDDDGAGCSGDHPPSHASRSTAQPPGEIDDPLIPTAGLYIDVLISESASFDGLAGMATIAASSDDPDARLALIADRMREALSAIAALLGVASGEFVAMLVDDAEMAQLHEDYSGIAGTTDVLTFDHHDGDAPPGSIWGDVAVCVHEAARQAAANGTTLEAECLLYATHGLLHLLGYDDHDPTEYERMHAREDELLTAVGYGAVFAARSKEPSRNHPPDR